MIGATITLGLIIALVAFLVIGVQKAKKKKELERTWADELPEDKGYLPDFIETDLH